MRVSRIEFQGYRRLADTGTNIDGPLTAFVGFNEAGKTSLLRALDWFTAGGELQAVDHNRSRPPTDDDTEVVKVYFELDDEDRKRFADVAMDQQPTSLMVYRKPDGGRVWSLTPWPRRPVRLFTDALDRLTAATLRLATQFEDSKTDTNDPAEWSSSVAAALKRPNSSWSEVTIDCLGRLIGWLSEVPAGRKQARDPRLAALLEDVQSLVAGPLPSDAVWEVLRGREPDFILFKEEDRNLETSYELNPQQRAIPPAVDRLLGIAGIDVDDMWNYVQTGDSTKRETALERGNDHLRNLFDQAWNQSKVTVRFNMNGTRLEVLIKELHGDGDVTNISERSDGLKTFVALVAFIESGAYKVPPVLLIDEAETHLHYDAQADLVGVLLKSLDATQVFYTTHSPGCLPGDLGTGIRVLTRDPSHADASIIKNNFWEGEGPGFSPLLFAMGAGAAAFSMCRNAVLAEGASDMVLLPTLIRMATGLDDLDYQVAPGLANAHGSGIRVEEVAAKVVYLTDGDGGGDDHKIALKEAGVDTARIFNLPRDHAVEDLIPQDSYIAVVNHFLSVMGEKKRFTVGDIATDTPIAKAFYDWAKKQKVRTPSKVEVAYALLRTKDLRLTATGRRALATLHRKFVAAFSPVL